MYRTGRSGSKRDSAGGNVLAGAAPSSVAGAAAVAAGGVIFGNVGQWAAAGAVGGAVGSLTCYRDCTSKLRRLHVLRSQRISEVQWAHLTALRGIGIKQYGQSLVEAVARAWGFASG